MSHWMDARIDSFAVMGVALKPGVSVGTTKPRIPSSVCAQITATLATLASPIQRLAPLMTQSSPSLRAKVCIEEGSEPAVGSVRPKQPMASPAAICGSHCCFCSSEPHL